MLPSSCVLPIYDHVWLRSGFIWFRKFNHIWYALPL